MDAFLRSVKLNKKGHFTMFQFRNVLFNLTDMLTIYIKSEAFS